MKNVLLAIVLFGGSIISLLFFSQHVTPISPLFPVRRLSETLILFTKRTPQAKVAYYQQLIEDRFSDISYLFTTGHQDILLAVSLRYATTVGKAVAVASSSHVGTSSLKTELTKQKYDLQVYLASFASNDPRQKYIEDDIHYITTYEKEL